MTTTTRIVWIGAAALVAAFFSIKILIPHDAEEAPKVVAEPNLFPFVRSFEGTRPDGDVKISGADMLMVDAPLRRLFDYYLSAFGEKSLDAIRAEIEAELERRLQPVAAAEAKRILARYLDYKRALLELHNHPESSGGTIETIRARLDAKYQVRARFFSEKETHAMFGFDDDYDMDAVARLEIHQDKALSGAQKQGRLAALDDALSPAIREARDAPLKVARQEELAKKMRTQGNSEDDIYRMRAAAFSPEAAARLAEVDRDETAWKNRIAAYLAERNTLISGNANLLDANRQAALQQLRETRFTADERKRLAAYE